MIGMVSSNASISRTQREGFMRTFIIVIVVIMLELAATLLDGSALKYIGLHSFVNFLGFLLSPMVALSMINLIAPKKYVRTYNLIGVLYSIINIIGVPIDLIFGINSTNVYFRSYGYLIFIAMYMFYIVVLMFETLRMYGVYQKTDTLTLIPLMALTIAGSSVQLIDPSLQTTWLAVTFLVILYYTHCTNLWHQLDGLTGLLSQKVYLRDLDKVKMNKGVFIFDIDDFKILNDSLGHSKGDKVLKLIAALILEVYGEYGTCYRIGGDEMSVIIHKHVDENYLNAMFRQRLNHLRTKKAYIPTVSIGCSIVIDGKQVSEVVDQADKLMYDMKRRQF